MAIIPVNENEIGTWVLPGGLGACEECGSRSFHLDEKRGEVVCKNCSLVIDKVYKEKQILPGDKVVFSPVRIARYSKNTFISYNNVDYLGNNIGKTGISLFRRLRRIDKRRRDSKSLVFFRAYHSLKKLTNDYGIKVNGRNEILGDFIKYYARFGVKGGTVDSLLCAFIYLKSRFPMTLIDISSCMDVDAGKIWSAIHRVTKDLHVDFVPKSPIEFLSRYASELDFPIECENIARELITKLWPAKISGKVGKVVGASLYVANLYLSLHDPGHHKEITQDEICDLVGVSPPTLRKGCRDLARVLGLSYRDLVMSNVKESEKEKARECESEARECESESPCLRKIITVALFPKQKESLDLLKDRGLYVSSSEAIRNAIRKAIGTYLIGDGDDYDSSERRSGMELSKLDPCHCKIITVNIDKSLDDFVDAAVEKGFYDSRSEFVRFALLRYMKKEWR